MGVPVPPLSVAVTPGWSGRRTSLWIRPPEGEPSSDLDPSPTGRGGDLGLGRGTRTWRAWDDAYSRRYHQAGMIRSHQGSGIFACHLLVFDIPLSLGTVTTIDQDTGTPVFRVPHSIHRC